MNEIDVWKRQIERIRKMHEMVQEHHAATDSLIQRLNAIRQAGESDFGILYGQLSTKNPAG